jgi:hypothetical protein
MTGMETLPGNDERSELMLADPQRYFEEATRRAAARSRRRRQLPSGILTIMLTGAAFLPILAPEALPLGALCLIAAAAITLLADRSR